MTVSLLGYTGHYIINRFLLPFSPKNIADIFPLFSPLLTLLKEVFGALCYQ